MTRNGSITRIVDTPCLWLALAATLPLTAPDSIPAQDANDTAPVSVETWLRQRIDAGEVADLTTAFPDPDDRVVDASFLEELLASGTSAERRGLQITGAVVSSQIDLSRAHVRNYVALHDCEFAAAVDFSECVFEQDVDFSSSRFASANFIGATFKQDLVLEGAHFDQGLRMSRVAISGILDADHCTFGSNGSTTLYQVQVGKSAYFGRAVFASHVNLRNARFGMDLDLTRAKFSETVDFRHMDVESTLYLHGTEFNGGRDGVWVRGMTYGYLTNAAQTRTDIAEAIREGRNPNEDPMALADEFIERTQYSADTYTGVAEYFEKLGYTTASDRVYINGKWRELGLGGPIQDVWNLFLWATVGYGRRPWLAFVWSGLLIAIGCRVFRPSTARIELAESDGIWQGESYDHWWCFWYSADLFLPAVNLRAADVWKVSTTSWWVRSYARIHTAAGWILIPIGIAAVMGIVEP